MEQKIDKTGKETGAASSKKGYNQIVITIRDGKVISFEQSVYDGAADGAEGNSV